MQRPVGPQMYPAMQLPAISQVRPLAGMQRPIAEHAKPRVQSVLASQKTLSGTQTPNELQEKPLLPQSSSDEQPKPGIATQTPDSPHVRPKSQLSSDEQIGLSSSTQIPAGLHARPDVQSWSVVQSLLGIQTRVGPHKNPGSQSWLVLQAVSSGIQIPAGPQTSPVPQFWFVPQSTASPGMQMPRGLHTSS
jgi:hypothetical protein